MKGMKVAALVFIVGGVLGLIYGGFTYTKETHESKIGSLKIAFAEKSTVNIPIAVSVGVIVLGTTLLLVGRKEA